MGELMKKAGFVVITKKIPLVRGIEFFHLWAVVAKNCLQILPDLLIL